MNKDKIAPLDLGKSYTPVSDRPELNISDETKAKILCGLSALDEAVHERFGFTCVLCGEALQQWAIVPDLWACPCCQKPIRIGRVAQDLARKGYEVVIREGDK